MKPIILFRKDRSTEVELEIAKKYFDCVYNRAAIPPDSLVIGRYSCYPYYAELEQDIVYLNSKLINSYRQHKYIADLGDWYEDLKPYTPQTWSHIDFIPDDEPGPFVLKGETNSKKFKWNTEMFAKTKRDAVDVFCRLSDDGLVGYQNIYIRKYVPLKTYLIGLSGLPVTKEFRVFVCYNKIISKGYYWSNHIDDLPEIPNPEDIPIDFLNMIISLIGKNANFYAIDVAQMEDGNWIVIEINDGQQSGLSMNDADVLYSNLKIAIEEKYNERMHLCNGSSLGR